MNRKKANRGDGSTGNLGFGRKKVSAIGGIGFYCGGGGALLVKPVNKWRELEILGVSGSVPRSFHRHGGVKIRGIVLGTLKGGNYDINASVYRSSDRELLG
ncbi:hypothetical protein IQ273_02420 [Nodosilinea sp. LEGE 07298]|uniref:hypothetical protein n=1 Tax=Nodosilinea sp. LEGE 07298 TaxID=2777970 RepID=UPI00187E0ACF|nr:hypothetical protein [Nodosilinea sp. LEGE 07298]MBE9108277.1 hypothetical protein [Nodosilinea sp. LEGE 07298]